MPESFIAKAFTSCDIRLVEVPPKQYWPANLLGQVCWRRLRRFSLSQVYQLKVGPKNLVHTKLLSPTNLSQLLVLTEAPSRTAIFK